MSSRGLHLTDGSVGAVLWRLTLPMVFGLSSLILFNLADAYFIGLLGTRELAAFAFTLPITTLVGYIGVGLGIGTSALVARALGSGEPARAATIAANSLLLTATVIVVIACAGRTTLYPVFRALGASAELLPFIGAYMEIWYLGATFVVLAMVASAVLRARGDMRTPAVVMLAAALLNALLDPILIFGIGPVPALGLRGAAVANALAWAASSVYLLTMLKRDARLLHWHWRGWAVLASAWREHLHLSAPAAAANMMTPLAISVLTSIIAREGHEAVAAYGVGARIESLALLVVLALSTSLPPFISQNLGAGRLDRVMTAVRAAMFFTLAWELLVYAALLAARPQLLALYAREPAVAEALGLLLVILPLSYGLQGIAILSNSSFNALHEPRYALVLSFLRWFGLYVPCAMVGAQLDGLRGLFLGAVLGNVGAGALGWIWLSRHCRRLMAEGGQGLVPGKRRGGDEAGY